MTASDKQMQDIFRSMALNLEENILDYIAPDRHVRKKQRDILYELSTPGARDRVRTLEAEIAVIEERDTDSIEYLDILVRWLVEIVQNQKLSIESLERRRDRLMELLDTAIPTWATDYLEEFKEWHERTGDCH